MLQMKTPFLGVAYYPEDWPETEIDKDIVNMKRIGITAVRIAEFAWHRMEPQPGCFDFSFFHKVCDKMYKAGIGVIMGTPTATPPIWLSRLYPDVLVEKESGRLNTHGGRRHCCSNNIHYNEYCMRIVEKMAQEFADDPAVIGWQIDNEIYSWDKGCFCPDCLAKFRERLRAKFGTIDRLNEAWDLNLFSQWYDDFTDIPAPRDAWHNPHLIMEWNIFQGESHVAFVRRQAEILHKYVKVPVGTDTMPFNAIDYRRMTDTLDIVEFNHYNTPENLYAECFWFDYLRTLKEHPFWNTETATCWNGSVSISQSIKPDGFCRSNSWLPVALGGEANMYWLWRTHWAGHELQHGAVIDTSGRDMLTVGEVEEVSEGFAKASDFIGGTRVKPDMAIHFSSLIWNMHASQSIVQDWDYMTTLEDDFYRPAVERGLRPDVIDAVQPLDDYKLIFTPMQMTLEEGGLGKRMAEWVRNGGTWVVGPLTDVRNINGARYTDGYYGLIEELTGTRFKYFAPDTEERIQAAWKDGKPFKGKTWFEMFEAEDDASVTVTGGHKAISGLSLLQCRKVGKGTVILLGTIPSKEDMYRLLDMACGIAGVEIPKVEGEVMVVRREGSAGSGLMLVEYGAKPAVYTLEETMTDVLTGETVSGRVEIEPYGVKVFKK